jgi:hypothetical protein
MNSLAGYVATICVAIIVAYLSQFLLPRIKIRYWLPSNFLYTVPANAAVNPGQPGQPAAPQLPPPQAAGQPAPPAPFLIQTNALTIQNFGRKAAQWVEIVHRRRPDFFQLYPSLNYTEITTPSGEHIIRIESLAHKESVTLQLLSYVRQPELLYIRSEAGHASQMPWMVVRKFPKWVYAAIQLLILVGAGFSAYWLIRIAIYLFKELHAP